MSPGLGKVTCKTWQWRCRLQTNTTYQTRPKYLFRLHYSLNCSLNNYVREVTRLLNSNIKNQLTAEQHVYYCQFNWYHQTRWYEQKHALCAGVVATTDGFGHDSHACCQLCARSEVRLRALIVAHRVREFLAQHGSQSFTTMFTKTCEKILSATPIYFLATVMCVFLLDDWRTFERKWKE